MSKRERGFEVVSTYKDLNIKLPERATKSSAGYDFFAIEDSEIPPHKINQKPFLVPTGIKSYMNDNECLILANRSSNPIKKSLILPNGIGLIDSDYYNNPDNEGHIMFQFINISSSSIIIKKGDKLGQGFFLPYLIADNDVASGSRVGGFGSTGK
jgi:dUTP pyrophosphatase